MIKKNFNTNLRLFFGIVIVLTFIIMGLFSLSNKTFSGHAILENQPDSIQGKDTYIRENLDSNFGAMSNFRIGKIISGTAYRSLIEFDFSSIPSSNTIINSTITLNLTYASNDNTINISAYRIITPWTEDYATWIKRTQDDLWSAPGGAYGEKIGEIQATDKGTYNLDITDITKLWVTNIYPNYGIILVSNDAENSDYKDFGSSNSENIEERPKLIIHHTANAAPSIESITINSDATNSIDPPENAIFTVEYEDLENDNAKLIVCNSSNITIDGCPEKTYCQTEYSSQKTIECAYQTKKTDSSENEIWIAVCDYEDCSVINKTLYVNHNPEVTLNSPNGNEQINQDNGNYDVRFETLDPDKDNLNISIYYGKEQNSTKYAIIQNKNQSEYCIDYDLNPLTPQICTFSWNTTGLYGLFYLTIEANDSTAHGIKSSDSEFNITSLTDIQDPIIENITISKNITTSGESIIFKADIIDQNLEKAWVEINTTPTSLKYFDVENNNYSATFEVQDAGIYSYKIYAIDIVGNQNSTQEKTFKVNRPDLIYQITDFPQEILPNHVIRISANITSQNIIKNLQAELGTEDSFIFLNETPKQITLGDFEEGDSVSATWFISAPLEENIYNFTINLFDKYGNDWETENKTLEISTESSVYQVDISGYPQAETDDEYYVESNFINNGIFEDADSVQISIYDPSRKLTVGPTSMTRKETGKYNFSYTTGSSSTEGQWETIVNFTKNGISYYKNDFWRLIGGPFDVRTISIIENNQDLLEISVIAENTGGANKDLILNWNLTEESNGNPIDSGTETFMVEGNSERIWTIKPTSEFFGQARITFIGYYGFDFTEKAGAYKIFTIDEKNQIAEPSDSSESSGSSSSSSTEPTNKIIPIPTENINHENDLKIIKSATNEDTPIEKQISSLKELLKDEKTLFEIIECEKILDSENDTEKTELCLKAIKDNLQEKEYTEKIPNYLSTIITWILILVAIIVGIRLIRRMSLVNLSNRYAKQERKITKKSIKDRILEIKKRIK